jgi:hypothetical protein
MEGENDESGGKGNSNKSYCSSYTSFCYDGFQSSEKYM